MTEACIYVTLLVLSVVATIFLIKNEFMLLGGVAFLMVYASLDLLQNQLTNKEPHMAEVTSVELYESLLEIRTDDGGIFMAPLHEGMDIDVLMESVTMLKNQVEDFIVNGEEYD